MIIPADSIEPETLSSIIEDWLSRQAQESAMDIEVHRATVQKVRDALKTGHLVITWDDESQTINLVNQETLI